GSEVTIRLRAAAEPPPQAQEPAPRATGTTRRARCRILVADDNQDSAESLAMLLRLSGHDVRTAHDGQEAVAIAQEFQPEVALLDLGMPTLTGYDAARRIREQPGGAKVVLIALTGWGQEEFRRRSRDAGFDHHLTKPVAVDALERLLDRTSQCLPERRLAAR
ncbi:MAG: response regulator, partial [Gemmatimonadales bacterium]